MSSSLRPSAPGAENPYVVKEVRFSSGERMPLLVRRATGIAIEAPSYWVTSERRPLGIQANTLQRDLRDIVMLYLWGDSRGFDAVERLQSPAFLQVSELNDLDRFCRNRVEAAVVEANGVRSDIAPAGPSRVTGAKSGGKRVVHAGRMQVRNRMASIHGFMAHVSSDHLSRLTVGSGAYRAYAAARSEMVAKWEQRYRSLDMPHDPSPRSGLDSVALERLRGIIHPDHPENPWSPEVRERNGLMVLVLWSLGIRRGELCALRTSDLKFTADRAFLSIVRRPDDLVDKRRAKPGVKTRGRELVIELSLASMIRAYVMGERRRHPGARKHPFLFVSSVDGAPLTLSSVNKSFRRLRAGGKLPLDLSPHVLRHTWNDAFSAASDRANPRRTDVDMTKEERMRSYLMGWSATSTMAARYSRRWTQEEANKRLLKLQGTIAHIGDVEPEPDA